MAKRGAKPWITPPSEDGGVGLAKRLEEIAEIAKITDVEKEIWCQLGISHDTWYAMKRKYSEISDVLDASWQKTILKVKASVLKKALNGDFQAQKLVLERKAGWLDKQQITHSGLPGQTTVIKLMLPEKIPKLLPEKNEGSE